MMKCRNNSMARGGLGRWALSVGCWAFVGCLQAADSPISPIEKTLIVDEVINWKELGVEEIVFSERHPGRDKHRHYYANFGYSCVDPNYWFHGADGGRLCRLNPGNGKLTTILEDPAGAVRDPQVHYDAKKILFSYRKGGTHNYHLYEIEKLF